MSELFIVFLFFFKCLLLLLCLSDYNKKGANKNNQVKGPLLKQRNMFVVRIKIMWEEQLVDPPIHFTTFVIALCYYTLILSSE